jgi:hypothetical protein
MLENDHFEFFTGSVIKGEIEKSKHHHLVKDVVDHCVQLFAYYQYGELLRPFFSLGEIKKARTKQLLFRMFFFLKIRSALSF